ncbi:MAG: alpha/beta hydrolase [Planctomycetaceae bacterium]|nr:alpha/beta hydrolase [Planctomycetaceae bacterium]
MILDVAVIRRSGAALVLAGVMALLSGCATTEFVQVRQRPHNPVTDRLKASSFGYVRHSKRSDSYLRQVGYRGEGDVKSLLQFCLQQPMTAENLEGKHALAEFQYLTAESIRTRDPKLSMELYLDAARTSWSYFAAQSDTGIVLNPADPQHRSTAEIYNTSTEKLLRLAKSEGRLQLGQSLRMPLTGRRLMFEIPFPSRMMSMEHFGEFEFVSDYQLKNLTHRHVSSGLGVPIIAIRPATMGRDPLEKYYTQGMSLAATMVLRFDDYESASGVSNVHLQIFDPRESDGLLVGTTLVPLETDVSTPLARFLSNPDLSLLDTWGLIRPDLADRVEGLYMVQPYDPDRIPVLMVHGFWSSPMTWMEMFNDLQADPEIRRKYQFWFYLYPTGEPVAFSAAKLREELQEVRRACDPEYRNSKLDEMVVVGHSMGGLLSHMLTINSGDKFWNSVSRKPVDELRTSDEVKTEIRKVFFFQSNPSVSRIVTIASPYGGSTLSNRFTRWLSGSLIWLPSRTMELSKVVFEQNEVSVWDRVAAPRTSIDSLTRHSGVLKMIRESHVPPEVKHHNIIAVWRGKNQGNWTDGVVTFASAHRQDVTSEKVVHAGHSEVVRHSETVSEIRRILLEHLEESQRRRFPVIPARQTVSVPGSRYPAPNVVNSRW